jgi:hypothetical protein
MIHVDDAKSGEVTAAGGIHGSGFGDTTQGCGQEPGSRPEHLAPFPRVSRRGSLAR